MALYGGGAGASLRGSLAAHGMGSIWISADEVLERRAAMGKVKSERKRASERASEKERAS